MKELNPLLGSAVRAVFERQGDKLSPALRRVAGLFHDMTDVYDAQVLKPLLA